MKHGLFLTDVFFNRAEKVLEAIRTEADVSRQKVKEDDCTQVALFSPELSSPEINAAAHATLTDSGKNMFLLMDANQVLDVLQKYHAENAVGFISRIPSETLDAALRKIPSGERREAVEMQFLADAKKLPLARKAPDLRTLAA